MHNIFKILTIILLSVITCVVNAKTDKLTIGLDWFINPDHAPLIIAQKRNFFKDVGLEVEMIEPADPNDPPKLVAAGKLDLAISYQPQLHIQVDQGLPVVRVGTLVSVPLNSLVVLKDGRIKSIADLKGKNVGFSDHSLSDEKTKNFASLASIYFGADLIERHIRILDRGGGWGGRGPRGDKK